MPRLAFSPAAKGLQGDVLIVIFLRGAADGLNILVPHGDEAYYLARPTLGIPRPDDKNQSAGARALDLDGFFGLHPALLPLMDAWQDGELGFVHACGSPDDSHSHFRAMDVMERGLAEPLGPASGWINRHLASVANGNPSPLRALAIGESVQRSLQGSVPVTALRSITEAHFGRDQRNAEAFQAALGELYAGPGMMESLGRETLELLQSLERLDPEKYRPEGSLAYPDSEFGRGLKQVAMLIKIELGLEVAALDLGGWDTHFAQGAETGLMANLLADLGQGLAAFHADLRDEMGKVTQVVMTEFGRRVTENASLGTDHGSGSVMLLMGGSVAGGRVHGSWPGLAPEQRSGPGDLKVTTDYRDVLAEIVLRRLGNPRLDLLFPGYAPGQGGFVRGAQRF
jgi:uncharacterized protein (DUF1501 family)